MKFKVEIDDTIIRMAADIVEKHCKDDEFLYRVGAVEKFNYCPLTGWQSASIIARSQIVMTVRPYTTWNPFSKVIGHAKGITIYCNTRKFDLPLIDRVENFVHEPLHLMGFKHRGNANDEFNKGTVPYLVAKMFRDYVIEKGIA